MVLRLIDSLVLAIVLRLCCLVLYGGEPFVLLFESITFGTPAGKKENEV